MYPPAFSTWGLLFGIYCKHCYICLDKVFGLMIGFIEVYDLRFYGGFLFLALFPSFLNFF